MFVYPVFFLYRKTNRLNPCGRKYRSLGISSQNKDSAHDYWTVFLFCTIIHLPSGVLNDFCSPPFFRCSPLSGAVEQSAVQLFRELSNPASDLSCAAQPNRIAVLTLTTIPPAVAEPPVGGGQKCLHWGGERAEWLNEEEDSDQQRHRRDAFGLMWNERGKASKKKADILKKI